MANPVLALKERCFAVDVVENVELEALQVGKVDAPQPVVGAIDHLIFFFIPDDRVPTVRKEEFICFEVPVPEAVVGSAHRQRVTLLNFSELELSPLFPQARSNESPVGARTERIGSQRNNRGS